MSYIIEARKLANYISSLDIIVYENNKRPVYNHIGALYTDIILQAGLNYKNVVLPRVEHLRKNYPQANTINGFNEAIYRSGLENIILWTHPTKINRIHKLIDYSIIYRINTVNDLILHLSTENNKASILDIDGVGPKTLDYLLKLLSFDTVAVDRHIYSFVKMAGIECVDYHKTKKIVEFAADFLQISRSNIDYSIWIYMSEKSASRTKKQMILELS